jgi:hypothetical protein
VVLLHPLPDLAREGDRVLVVGRVRGPAPNCHGACEIELEGKRLAQSGSTSAFNVLARVPWQERRNRFSFVWSVPKRLPTGPVTLRVALTRAHQILALSRTRQAFIGPAPIYCAPPAPPSANLPSGDGWIVGGAYIEGGPFPGVYECFSRPYTVTASDHAGEAVASEQVAGSHSYTLIVPAGSYTLKATPCGFASASVSAGKETRADVVCPVP